jgi:hypothetical protein
MTGRAEKLAGNRRMSRLVIRLGVFQPKLLFNCKTIIYETETDQ